MVHGLSKIPYPWTPLLLHAASVLTILHITHLVEVLMRLRSLANQLLKVLKVAACTRSILAVWDRSWRRVRNESNIGAWAVAMHSTPLAGHLLHADVTEEGDEIALPNRGVQSQ
jgi:hypothetical protein